MYDLKCLIVLRSSLRVRGFFYGIVALYMLVAGFSTFIVLDFQSNWSRGLRLFFNLGIMDVYRSLIWTNVISLIVVFLVWSVEQLRFWGVRLEQKRLHTVIHELKSKLYDNHLSDSASSSDRSSEQSKSQATESQSGPRVTQGDRLSGTSSSDPST